MAGSNPYLLSEAENERIFREEILLGNLKKYRDQPSSCRTPSNGHQWWSAVPMHEYASAKLKMA
jgi:hypothetical protein